MKLFSHNDKPVDDLIYLEILNAENRKKTHIFYCRCHSDSFVWIAAG